MRWTVSFLAVVLLLATPVLAEDLNDPPWDTSAPGTTYQRWDFPIDLDFPTEVDNPYGGGHAPPFDRPFIDWPATAAPEEIEDWNGQPVMTWHIGGLPGEISQVAIWVPNDPTPNPFKLIFWQVTSDKSPTPTGSPPTTNPPGTSVPTGIPHTQHGNTNWYTYNGMLQIMPNPDGEWIIFEFAECTNIEEIVIDTICFPEPATMGLFAAGGLALLARRKRR